MHFLKIYIDIFYYVEVCSMPNKTSGFQYAHMICQGTANTMYECKAMDHNYVVSIQRRKEVSHE